MGHSILRRTLEAVHDMIFSKDFKDNARTDEKRFSRNRKMPFHAHILYILAHCGKSLQVGLNAFFADIHAAGEACSKQAFSKQRQYIRPEAIRSLFELTATQFYESASYKTYHGYVVAAIDGSRCNLPDNEELKNVFGEQVSNGAPQNQALISSMYDVLNGLYLDASINACRANERKLALEHLDALSKYNFTRVILLMDRGYPSGELFSKLSNSGVKFLVRCDRNHVLGMKLTSNDCVIEHKFHSIRESVTLRIVRVQLSNGEEEILATNLFDSEFTPEELMRLYHTRWGIETSYNHEKNVIEIENFSGNTEIAVRQDFYACMFLYNLAGTLVFDMQEEIDKAHNKGQNTHIYKQNMAQTVGSLKTQVVEMLLANSNIARGRKLAAIHRSLLRSVSIVRPRRSFPRSRKHLSSKFHNNLKHL